MKHLELWIVGLCVAAALLLPVGTSHKPGPTPTANDLGGAIRQAHSTYAGAWRTLGAEMRDGIRGGSITPEQAANVFGERLAAARESLRAHEADAVKTHLQGRDKDAVIAAWASVAR